LFSDPHKTHKYTVWVERTSWAVKPGGTYSNQWAFIVYHLRDQWRV